MYRLFLVTLTLSGGAFYCSCGPALRDTVGKNGRVDFVFEKCVIAGPQSSCDGILEPIAPNGARVSIEPRSAEGSVGPLSFSAARSSDSSIFSAVVVGQTVVVTTAQPGRAELRLLDGANAIVDSIDLTVGVARSVRFETRDLTTVAVIEDSSQTVRINRIDDRGNLLLGTGGIDYQFGGTLLRDADTSFDRDDEIFHGSPVTFHGSRGLGTITATVGTASATLPVAVVAAVDVQTIAVEPTQFPLVFQGQNLTEVGTTGALADGTPVFGIHCAWSGFQGTLTEFVDASLRQEESFFIDEGHIWWTYFQGSGSATCTAGSASTTVTVP